MEEASMMEWVEDVCEVCGAHVGYGIKLFHLGRCDEHSDSYDEDSTTPSRHDDSFSFVEEKERCIKV